MIYRTTKAPDDWVPLRPRRRPVWPYVLAAVALILLARLLTG